MKNLWEVKLNSDWLTLNLMNIHWSSNLIDIKNDENFSINNARFLLVDNFETPWMIFISASLNSNFFSDFLLL